MSAETRCRSNCDRPITMRLDAVSQSGRNWTSYSCDDPDHYASCRNMIDALGFDFTGQEVVADLSHEAPR